MSEETKQPKTDYTRDELLAVCERAASVPVERWSDRDAATATRQLGEAWAFLKSGNAFCVLSGGGLDDRTIWVEIDFPGFQAFEYGRDRAVLWESERYYLPTPQRLDDSEGRHWY